MTIVRILVLLCAVALCLVAVTASAAPTPVLVRSMVSGGGEAVAAGAFVLQGTVGEAVSSQPLVASDCAVASGYWRDLPLPYTMHLPAVRK